MSLATVTLTNQELRNALATRGIGTDATPNWADTRDGSRISDDLAADVRMGEGWQLDWMPNLCRALLTLMEHPTDPRGAQLHLFARSQTARDGGALIVHINQDADVVLDPESYSDEDVANDWLRRTRRPFSCAIEIGQRSDGTWRLGLYANGATCGTSMPSPYRRS